MCWSPEGSIVQMNRWRARLICAERSVVVIRLLRDYMAGKARRLRDRIWGTPPPCCDAFRNSLSHPGQEWGFYVRPRTAVQPEHEGVFPYYLVCRAVDVEDHDQLNSPVPVSLESFLLLRHCPWCGARLLAPHGS